MKRRPYLDSLLLLAISTLPIATAGCAAVTPVPRVDPGVEAATLVGAPVEFHIDAEAIDVEDAVAGTLTLTDAVRRAVLHDPKLQSAFARVRAAEADAAQARLLPNPILAISLRRPEGGGTPGLDISLAQDLFSLFQIEPRSASADARLRQSAVECLTVALDVVSAVREQYVALQTVEARAPLATELLRLLEESRKLAQSRLDAGEGVRSDVTSLDAERASSAIDLTEIETQRREHRLALARLIGMPSAAADWSVEPGPVADLAIPAERACIDTALARRPEVQSRQWDLAALEQERQLAGLPLLDGLSGGIDAEGAGDWSIGPSGEIPLPVFDTGQARRAKADAAIVESRHLFTETKRSVVEEVRNAWWAIENARRVRDRIRDELIPLQERRRGEIEAAFRAGEQEVTALLLASQDLQAARVRRLESDAEIAKALVRLERAVGGPAALRDAVNPSSPK